MNINVNTNLYINANTTIYVRHKYGYRNIIKDVRLTPLEKIIILLIISNRNNFIIYRTKVKEYCETHNICKHGAFDRSWSKLKEIGYIEITNKKGKYRDYTFYEKV